MRLWAQLNTFARNWNEKCFYSLGYYNCIRDDSERLNCIYRRSDVDGFNRLIDNVNLLDPEIDNAQYTWYGPTGKRCKFDRILFNNTWWGSGQWSLRALNRKKSNHKPLLLYQQQTDWGPVPFKVYNYWLKNEELCKLVEDELKNSSAGGNTNVQVLLKKAKAVI
ncbi:hypothetical protein POM88_012618 [Heracleum sosnowskyi]|uniref:Uncharacterized protein n=1 Tax=Heracleum sosnowskyi TaxID=360622 RepID=A0AAD8IWT3_9APIA|nr:hypothetical protein POM88_012618 [Heracleum sosnowskyi]